MEEKELTLGEKRVGKTFNPSGIKTVDKIKELSAQAIDLLETLRVEDGAARSAEAQRVISTAQTNFENASMWGVKANFV